MKHYVIYDLNSDSFTTTYFFYFFFKSEAICLTFCLIHNLHSSDSYLEVVHFTSLATLAVVIVFLLKFFSIVVCKGLQHICSKAKLSGCKLHWPRIFFHFWMHVPIENFVLIMEITLFLVYELLFARKLTFNILVNLKILYPPNYYMYFFMFLLVFYTHF